MQANLNRCRPDTGSATAALPALIAEHPPKRQQTPGRPHLVISGTHLGLGGIRTHLVQLCRLLLNRGASLDMFTTGSHWSPELIAEVRNQGANIHLPPERLWPHPRLGALYAGMLWPLRVPRLANSLYCIGPGKSHLWLHRFKPRGALSINHEIVVPPGPDSLAGRCASGLDVTVANSREVRRYMRRHWPGKPVRVIPFLTSAGPSPPPRRSRVGETPILRVVYLGRLVAHKRPHALVQRWQDLKQRPGVGPARLDLYGFDPEGSMLENLREFVSGTRQTSEIQIHGEYDLRRLPEIFAQADLVVLPSVAEGLPLVLVEAMLHGIPFVACAAGGTAELGQDNPDSVVTTTDWEDFEDGFVSLAHKVRAGQINPLRLHTWAEQRYGYEIVARQWMECLTDTRDFFGQHD